MSKLIFRAKVNLDNAHYNYAKAKQDDFNEYIDVCCFNLHQCMEFYLKGIVELQGNSYVTNHDLRAQINKINSQNDNELDAICDEIRIYAATFNSWETESRYKDSFIALNKDILKAFELSEKLKEYCERLIKIENCLN